MNVSIDYQYRDAGNYKNPGAVIVANPDALDLAVAWKRLDKACDSNCSIFVASRVAFPDLFFQEFPHNEDDVDFHELLELRESPQPVTDDRTLLQIVEEFEKKSVEGWWVDLYRY